MKFISVDAISKWSNGYMGMGYLGDGIVYTQKDGMFHYFILNTDRYYVLAMTSLRDFGDTYFAQVQR